MRLRAGLRVALAMALAGAGGSLGTACYLITPYSDLTGGGAAGDGGTTSLPDGVASHEGSTSFCSREGSAYDFCDDFDDVDGSLSFATTRWSSQEIPTGDTLAIDRSFSLSAPGSLLVSIPDASIATGYDALYKDIGSGGVDVSYVYVAFDVHLDELPLRDPTFLLQVAFGGRSSAQLWATPGFSDVNETVVEADGSTTQSSDKMPWSPRSGASAPWSHVEMTFTFPTDAAAPSYVATIDGETMSYPLHAELSRPNQIGVGFTYVNLPAEPRTVHIDNVVLDWH